MRQCFAGKLAAEVALETALREGQEATAAVDIAAGDIEYHEQAAQERAEKDVEVRQNDAALTSNNHQDAVVKYRELDLFAGRCACCLLTARC